MYLLFKKQIHDVLHKFLLYIALFFIVLVGMIFYSGFTGARNDITNSISNFYSRANLATYNIETRSFFNIDEINELINNNEDLTLDYYYKQSVATLNYIYHRTTFNTNIPDIVAGSNVSKTHDIIIDYDYALANGMSVGQYVILGDKAYYICGLAKFPEHIFKGNIIPDTTTYYVALTYDNDVNHINCISIASDISRADLENLISTYLSNDDITITYYQDNYGYNRLQSDLSLVTSILFIFPFACFISIVIILYINYNRIVEEQKTYIGILKANGFSIIKIYFSLLIIPILLVLISSIIGSTIGVNYIPKYYINIISGYYCLPTITSDNIVFSIIVPIIVLLIVTILTISIPIILTIKKTPVELLKSKAESKFGRTFLRNIKFIPYHVKLIIRNTITSKKKNVCMIIASCLLLGVMLAVFYIEDSLNYSAYDLAKANYNGDYFLSIKDNGTIYSDASPIDTHYFIGTITFKSEYETPVNNLCVFDNTEDSIRLQNSDGNNLNMQEFGIYVPEQYRDYGLNKGDTITIYLSSYGYKTPFNMVIADFLQEVGNFKFAISVQTLAFYDDALATRIRNSNSRLITLKEGYNIEDLALFISSNYQITTPSFTLQNTDNGLLSFNDNIYRPNHNLIYYLETLQTDYTIYGMGSNTSIVLNDNLDILSINVFTSTQMFKNLGDNGIYLPKSYEGKIKDNKITIYFAHQIREFNVVGYVEGSSAYVCKDYLATIGIDATIFNYHSYLKITDPNQIDELTSFIYSKASFSNFELTSIDTFGSRLGLISDLVSITKYIAITLAGIVFILLIYNIGTIGLTNRLNDIKCFKSAGLKNSKLKHMLSYENLLVVVVGSILSFLVGFLIADDILLDIYTMSGVRMILTMTVSSTLLLILLAIILISITSFLINRKINKLNLATLMKGE